MRRYYSVTPRVISELKAAGVPEENVVFLGSFATYRPMTATEVQQKLGPDIEKRFAWTNHECFFGCKEIGTTSFKLRS